MHEQPPVKCHGLGGRSTMTDEIYGNVFDHHSVVYEFANGVSSTPSAARSEAATTRTPA